MGSARLASLPMYELPELREFTDAWWAGLAQALRRAGVHHVPPFLSRGGLFGAEWRNPDLLFSQCCGMDFITHGRESLRLLATPTYTAPGCQGSYYCSLVMVRTDDPAQSLADLRLRRAAINMPGSHSGHNALRALIAPLAQGKAFFSAVSQSGSHANSVLAVRDNIADCAAIDCVSFALLQRYRPDSCAGLRVLMRSPLSPGLPYVTHSSTTVDQIRRLQAGVFAALSDPKLADIRAALLLQDAELLAPEAYQFIADRATMARKLGYPEVV